MDRKDERRLQCFCMGGGKVSAATKTRGVENAGINIQKRPSPININATHTSHTIAQTTMREVSHCYRGGKDCCQSTSEKEAPNKLLWYLILVVLISPHSLSRPRIFPSPTFHLGTILQLSTANRLRISVMPTPSLASGRENSIRDI
jgi:hypothetical protein